MTYLKQHAPAIGLALVLACALMTAPQRPQDGASPSVALVAASTGTLASSTALLGVHTPRTPLAQVRPKAALATPGAQFQPKPKPTTAAAKPKASNATTARGATSARLSLLPCGNLTYRWPAHISSAWQNPGGCWNGSWYLNPANFVKRPSVGWCSWLPEVVHPELSGSAALHLPSHSTPKIGATVYYRPGVAGAGSDGHYSLVVSISPDGKWFLSADENYSGIRGGGFGRLIYRFVKIGPGMSFRW